MPRIQDTRELGAAPTLAAIGTVRERIPVPTVVAVPFLVLRSIARQTVMRHPVPWCLAAGAAVVTVAGEWTLALVLAAALLALTSVYVLGRAAAAGASPLPWAVTSVRTMSRRKRIRRTWRAWCLLHGLTSAYTGKPMRRQRRATATPNGLALDCYPGEAARAATDVQGQAYRLAALASVERRVLPTLATAVLGPGRVREVQVRHLSPSVARVYISWTSHLDAPLGPTDIPAPLIGRITIGITTDGTNAAVPAYRSVLLGGEPGSGKSTTLHAYVMDIRRQRIPLRLRVLDPKGGVELSEYDPDRGGSAHVYEQEPRKAPDVLEHMRRGMERRLASMRHRRVTQHVPTEGEPWDLLIVDEMLLLALADDENFQRILAAGRAACYTVVALTQLGLADLLGPSRGLFPVRICMGTRTWQTTDTILGSGATKAGARCHTISLSEQGQGFFFSEEDRGFTRFKCPHIQDPDKARIGAGYLPAGVRYADALQPARLDRRTQPGPIPFDDPEGEPDGDDG